MAHRPPRNDPLPTLYEQGTIQQDIAYYDRTYVFTDTSYQKHEIIYRVAKSSVAESEQQFGFSEEELLKALNRQTLLFNKKYSGRAQVKMESNLKYSIRYNLTQKKLVQEFNNIYDETWAKYCKAHQSLRYQISPARVGNKLIFGYWPPVICLNEIGGDCDSKSTLFATILYHYQPKLCVLIMTERHAFIGIHDQHKVFPTDKVARIGGIDYLLLETTSQIPIGIIAKEQIEQLQKGKFKYLAFH